VKTILCVDDIETNLYTLKSLFDTYYKNEYNIILASSGQEALGVLLSKKVDIILLDVMMPEMDGYETASLILKNKKTKDIPIIFVTAKKDDSSIDRCYEVGGVDYLNKPYNSKELFVRISFHLDLVKSKEKLYQEKKFAQDILDLQENLIIVTDGAKVGRINKATADFFNLDLKKGFNDGSACLSSMFLEEEDYFHMGLVDKNQFWIDALAEKLKKKSHLVLLKNINTNKNESFSININEFNNKYLLSLINVTDMVEQSKSYKHNAIYDNLTQIYNRHKLNEIIAEKLEKAELLENKFSFIILDIDHFKMVNDNYGHLVGDDVLIHLSKLIKEQIRDGDVFARWGGEEFVLLLSNVDIDIASEIADKLRVKIELEYFAEVNNITCSFGVSSYEKNDTIDTITNRADKALYEAKESGRNKVCKLITKVK
jgi:two-component system cell cycle response regulator